MIDARKRVTPAAQDAIGKTLVVGDRLKTDWNRKLNVKTAIMRKVVSDAN